MYNIIRTFCLVVALCVGLMVQSTPTKAATLGAISIINADGTSTEYEFNYQATQDDGDGNDWVAVVCTNADGTIADVDIFAFTVGGLPDTQSSDCDEELGQGYVEPVTLQLYDTSTPFTGGNENSEAGLIYARGFGFVAGAKSDCVNSDGRLNPCQGGATVAVYCENNGVTVYAIYKGVGYLAFKMTKAEIDAFPKKPARNLLIKQAKGARLYRLSSGELQVNRAAERGQDYVFRWHGCDNS